MLTSISPKQKNIALVIGSLLLVFLSYKRIYTPLFNNVKLLKVKQKKIDLITNSEFKLAQLQETSSQLNHQIGEFVNSDITQQEILAVLAKHSSVNIAKIPEVHLNKESLFTTYTYQITLEGNYNSLAKVIFNLESDLAYSKIKNLKYSLKKNFNKKNQLFVLITFQNYEKHN